MDPDEKPKAEPKTDPTDIELQFPVDFGTERITKLTLRPPRAGDMRKARFPVGDPDSLTMVHYLDLLSSVTGYEPPVIDLLDMRDVKKCTRALSEYLQDFLGGGDESSATSP